ncbi:type III restriction enzyme, res subunit, partial [Vibrio cholerae HC-17A1]
QYYAVNAAVLSTIRASNVNANSPSAEVALRQQGRNQQHLVLEQKAGDRKAGVVWHTQGSGKSLSMVFYTGKIVLALDNPTVVVITDRNDLDDQLFGTFSSAVQLLRQTPKQAENREELKELLKVGSGGV